MWTIRAVVFLSTWVIVTRCWSDPLLISTPGTIGFGRGLYTSATSNVTHFVFEMSNESSSAFYYRQLYPNQTLSEVTLLEGSRKPYYFEEIVGCGQDDRVLCAVAGAERRFESAGQYYILFDVLHFSSEDGGESWTGGAYIPHLDGIAERQRPSLLYVKETGRLFVFYMLSTNGKHYIAQVTKPADSSIFSWERSIYSARSLKFGSVSSAYSLVGSKVILHLVWQEDDRVFYMQSDSNGLLWSAPRYLGQSLPKVSFIWPQAIVAAVGNAVVAMFINEYSRPAVVTSSNRGLDWSAALLLDEQQAYLIALAQCPSAGDKPLFATIIQHEANHTDLVTGLFNFAAKRLDLIESPFGQLKSIHAPVLRCLPRSAPDDGFTLQVLANPLYIGKDYLYFTSQQIKSG